MPRTSFVLDCFPPSWRPYAELCRIHKPAGISATYFPYLFGLLYISIIRQLPPSTVLVDAIAFLVAASIERAAGCVWNDIVDRDLDRQVARSKNRPIARDDALAKPATVFAAALWCIWISVLKMTIPHGWRTALPITGLVLLYPFYKRFTNLPQVFLGVTFSSAMLLGASAEGVFSKYLLGELSHQWIGFCCLFLSSVLWTVVYDTIYAFQDVEDDIKAGAKSMAVLLGAHARLVLLVCSGLQAALLFAAGFYIRASYFYFAVSTLGGAGLTCFAVFAVDLRSSRGCAWWFQALCNYGGMIISVGLFLEYLNRLPVPLR